MRFNKLILVVFVLCISLFFSGIADARKFSDASKQKAAKQEDAVLVAPSKTIALGDVDAGYSMSGQKASDVKETIQLMLKKELEKVGKGRYAVKITSPAVVAENAPLSSAEMPMLPTDRAPTPQEMSKYLATMQRWQQQMSGQVKVHKAVTADAFFEFAVSSGQGGVSTGGVTSTVGDFVDIPTGIGNVDTSSSRMDLVCTMRDPATGELLDRYVAKASSVKVRNLMGFTSYDYGEDTRTKENLFRSAVSKCAKWISTKVE